MELRRRTPALPRASIGASRAHRLSLAAGVGLLSGGLVWDIGHARWKAACGKSNVGDSLS